jgi:hypothetical protein
MTMRPLEPSELLAGLMVILRAEPSHMSLLVSEVNRNFSRASLAFEMSSRRNTSLMSSENVSGVIGEENQPVRVKTVQQHVNEGKDNLREKTNLFITILRRRVTSL